MNWDNTDMDKKTIMEQNFNIHSCASQSNSPPNTWIEIWTWKKNQISKWRLSLTFLTICWVLYPVGESHYNDVIMSAIASQITSVTIFTRPSIQGADQRKHQSSASLAFVRGIHRWPVNSPHKGPVPRKMFPFDDVIMPCFVTACCLSALSQYLNQCYIGLFVPLGTDFSEFRFRKKCIRKYRQ